MRRRIQGRLARVHCSGARRSRPADVLSGFAAKTRLAMACRIGADVVLDHRVVDVAAEVQRLTGGGADVAIEALDTPATFEGAFRSLRPAGTLSSLGVYSGKLGIPYDSFAAGLGDHRIVPARPNRRAVTRCSANRATGCSKWRSRPSSAVRTHPLILPRSSGGLGDRRTDAEHVLLGDHGRVAHLRRGLGVDQALHRPAVVHGHMAKIPAPSSSCCRPRSCRC